MIERDSGAPDFRILSVSYYGGDLTLNDVTISGGQGTTGGGIYSFGTLTLNDSIVTGNYSSDSGGGIANFGTMTLNRSEVSYNSTYAYSYGGGILGYGTLIDSSVHHNTAGSGGGISALNGFTLINSTVSENEATFRHGGGIFRGSSGSLTVTDSTIRDNSSYRSGAGIFVRYSGISMTGSTISGNSSLFGNGGGLYLRAFGAAQIANNTITANTVGFRGGGIYVNFPTNVDVEDSTITGNTAGFRGGGIFNNGTTDAIRSLISGNTADYEGDEVFTYNTNTFTGNNFNVFGQSGVDNAAAFYNFTPSGSDVTATSNGNNPTPLAGILDPLADNGGPTLTHALPSGSPAIDIAPTGPATDQRGEPRPGGAAFDAGAYEDPEGSPINPVLYVSPRTAGDVGGIAAKPQDIMAQDMTTGDWSMHFDGSDVGVTRPLAAFTHLSDGSLLLALNGSQNLPGVNGATANDVVRFVPTSLGDTTAGTFEWYIDGSDVGLSTGAEKIDALDALSDGRLLISPTGNASVPLGGGMQQKVSDEDLLALTPTATGANSSGTWALHFDGSAVPGLGSEDVVGAHLDEVSGALYLVLIDGFNVGTPPVQGNGRDILKLSPNGGGFDVTRFWRGSDNAFSPKLQGVDID